MFGGGGGSWGREHGILVLDLRLPDSPGAPSALLGHFLHSSSTTGIYFRGSALLEAGSSLEQILPCLVCG